MATYIVLANFTEQGIRNIKDTLKRAEAFKETAGKLGVRVKALCWTLGHYDIVITLEGPDDLSATALGLAAGAMGNVRTSLEASLRIPRSVTDSRSGPAICNGSKSPPITAALPRAAFPNRQMQF